MQDVKLNCYYFFLFVCIFAADAGPSNRWGHSMCMISENEAVLTGGQGDRHILCKDAIWRLDMSMVIYYWFV